MIQNSGGCTEAIQKAFDAASAVHGTVVVPEGTYVTGTVYIGFCYRNKYRNT